MKRLAKWIICTLTMCAILLTGCGKENTADTSGNKAPAELFQIEKQDTTYVLTFTDVMHQQFTQKNLANLAPYFPEFDSVAQMKAHIESGDLTAEEMRTLYTLSAESDSFTLIDLDNLWDITLPENVTAKVSWRGNEYWFLVNGADVEGQIIPVSEATFAYNLEEGYTNYPSSVSGVTVLSDDTSSEDGARVVNFDTGVVIAKSVFYEMEEAGKTLYIREDYILENPTEEDAPVSSEIPAYIHVYYTESGRCFSAFFTSSEKPTQQWYKAFHLYPLEEG